jgi:hypothetical protein
MQPLDGADDGYFLVVFLTVVLVFFAGFFAAIGWPPLRGGQQVAAHQRAHSANRGANVNPEGGTRLLKTFAARPC